MGEKVENKKSSEDLKKEFLLSFAKAFGNLPLDNIITKGTTKTSKYTYDEVKKYIENPNQYQKQLREVVDNLTITYPQFNVLQSYLPNMALLNYVLVPTITNEEKIDTDKMNKEKLKVAQYLEILNIKYNFLKALNISFRYDSFFGYEVETKDTYVIKQLNPDYCRIYATDEFGCDCIEFNFGYFRGANEKLVYGDELGRVAYPDEFRQKYELYKKDNKIYQWQSLDKGLVFKYYDHIKEYSIPPFISLFDSLMDIDNYRSLSRAKAETEVWKLLAMEVPMKKDAQGVDDFALSMDIIELFNSLAQQQVPSGVGIITTPMPLKEVNFNKNGSAEKNNVQDSIDVLFDNSGFSKLLFSGADNSTALSYSVKVDEQRLFGLYRQIEAFVNKKLILMFKGRYRIKILNMSKFSEKDTVEMFTSAMTTSAPTKTTLMASLGFTPMDIIGLEVLENQVMKLHEKWIPPQSAFTQSGDGEGGRPQSSDEDLGESGANTRKIDGNERGV